VAVTRTRTVLLPDQLKWRNTISKKKGRHFKYTRFLLIALTYYDCRNWAKLESVFLQ